MNKLLIISLMPLCLLKFNITEDLSNNYNNVYVTRKMKNNVSSSDFIITDQKYYFFKSSNLVVYGNHDNLQKNQINKYINEGNNVLIYDYYLDDNFGTNIFDLNSAVFYSNINGKRVDIINADCPNFNDFKNTIMEFYNEKSSLKLELISRTIDNNLFQPLYSGSFREVKKPYGYIDVIYTVKKYRANDVSSLYLVESKASFTPGKMAKDNGDKTYGNWYNNSGYFHVQGLQAVNELNQATIRTGGIPKFKDAYPENSPGTITVSSSYSIGTTLGYSFTNGFSLDNITISKESSLGLNISYGYDKSYTTSEPALSTQRSSIDSSIYQWTYTYNTSRNETNHLNTGYLFEMNNENHDLFEGDLSLTYAYKMTVKDKGWWVFEKTKSFDGTKYLGYY